MNRKRTYYPPTTSQQRKLLFEIWERTGNVTAACREALVGRATFYYWKPRFDRDGYTGLEVYEKAGVAKGTGRIPNNLETQVLELHREHNDWGKQRLANEIARANNWERLVSPNTVRRILEDAGMWTPEERKRNSAPT